MKQHAELIRVSKTKRIMNQFRKISQISPEVMWKLTTYIFIFFLTTTVFGSNIDSKVKSVTVFQNQAKVSRIVQTRLIKGYQTLTFEGLSGQLDPETIQIKGMGDFMIMGTTFQRDYLNQQALPSGLRNLQDSIHILEAVISRQRNQLKSLKEEESLLVANKVFSGKNENLTVQALKSMADFYRQRISQIGNEQFEVTLSKDKMERRLSALQSQFQEQRQLINQAGGQIAVEVQANNAGVANLEITYVVNGVSWTPVYDLRANSDGRKVELQMMALVSQSTGENWQDVNITLSTGNPSKGGRLPGLNPWYLDYVRNYPVTQRAAPSEERSAMMSKVMMDAVPMENVVERVELLNMVNYEIGVPYTLLSGRKPTRVAIRTDELEADFLYRAIPAVSSDVFLVANLKGWKNLDLISGNMNIYLDGGFVTKTMLNPNQSGEMLDVSLGVDPNVSASRERIKDLTKDQTIGGNRKVTYAYELTVVNKKGNAIMIELLDQVPVSRQADIEVDDIEINGAEMDRTTGKVTWKMTLAHQETMTKRLSYQIKFPKDKLVVGL